MIVPIPKDSKGRDDLVRKLAKEYPQRVVAEMLGVTQQHVSRLLSGRTSGKA